ncbi:hypothetical protein J7T55_015181 [Diaporthe amygdali]|uniref:uncharacterized protein n=1 Tax=Phomopsis amygdali TaxID=1214568 RepID=UPI0022FE25BF|nr:uncharacterized protein J7T55_015181 [Diaporthe amygdali]KAJ0120454.1 hypothetical protein J7T55_015181 [Diaporthe amygdali]
MSSEEAQKFIDEVWGLQGVAYVVVVLRYYSRIVTLGWGKLALDDYLIALATLVYTAESTAAYYVVAYWKGLANNGMSDQDRIELDPSSEEWLIRVNGSKTHVIGLLLYMTLLWLLKGCWVVYYLRLTDGLPSQKFLTKWAMLAGDSDPAQSGYWSVRESFVSFVLTNMPMLYPLLKSFLEKIGTTMGFTNNNGESGRATGSGQAYRLGSYPDQHKKTKNRDPNPVPEETRYGSNEHIVPANDESHGADSRSEGISLDDRSHDPFHAAHATEPF